jgi:hypothetical protein
MGGPSVSAFSRDGSTLVVGGDSLKVFRPSIELDLQAPSSMVPPVIIGVRATVDGAPLLGANLTLSVNGTSINCTVTEKGEGYYEIRTFEGYVFTDSFVPYNVTVSKAGLRSSSATAPVLVENYPYYPSYPSYSSPDYSLELNDLRSQVGGLQGIALLLGLISAVTMIVLVLFVWRSRKA